MDNEKVRKLDGRNLSRVKQWPPNEMVKAIDRRIPTVCPPIAGLPLSFALFLSVYSVLRDPCNANCTECRNRVENRYRRSPTKHQSISPLHTNGISDWHFRIVPPNFPFSRYFVFRHFIPKSSIFAIFFFFFFSPFWIELAFFSRLNDMEIDFQK